MDPADKDIKAIPKLPKIITSKFNLKGSANNIPMKEVKIINSTTLGFDDSK